MMMMMMMTDDFSSCGYAGEVDGRLEDEQVNR